MSDEQQGATTPAKKTRKAADRGLTTPQIKLLGHLSRVDVATPQGLQAANVSDRTPKTIEVLEREGYIDRFFLAEPPLEQHNLTGVMVYYLTPKGHDAVNALRALV